MGPRLCRARPYCCCGPRLQARAGFGHCFGVLRTWSQTPCQDHGRCLSGSTVLLLLSWGRKAGFSALHVGLKRPNKVLQLVLLPSVLFNVVGGSCLGDRGKATIGPKLGLIAQRGKGVLKSVFLVGGEGACLNHEVSVRACEKQRPDKFPLLWGL